MATTSPTASSFPFNADNFVRGGCEVGRMEGSAGPGRRNGGVSGCRMLWKEGGSWSVAVGARVEGRVGAGGRREEVVRG
ncbi:unnamed protein product [Linum trigynum]|uniref:Uncharacterized protein n=1 Tax=Linum trigynum TaxID=586398 RepID=A0AAV2F710_9ROSI